MTDSTCDLPAETISKHGIGVVPVYIHSGNEEYRDGVDITRAEFYKRLPSFTVHPTTAVPAAAKIKDAYEQMAREGASEILSVHISSALSAVVQVAQTAAAETKSVRVTVLDSHQLSMGMGFLVERAASLAAQGLSMKDIGIELNEQILRSHVFAALDTLEFLRRSGRMNNIIAGIGTLIQLKPILTMYNGKPGAERVRTREGAIKRLIQMLESLGELERVAIVHTHAAERVVELKERTSHLLAGLEVLAMDITPVIGAHIGPDAVGFAALAKRRTS